ncbi:MAG: hypothetical protein ACRBN8_40705 [Nannocystales bacterium]
MRSVFVIGMIAVLGCGQEDALVLWRDCDAAFAALEPPGPLPSDSIAPLKVGRTMPVLRITTPAPDAESLANRALATACVLTGDDVWATTALPEWAEQVAAGEDDPEVGAVFDDPNLWLSTGQSPTGETSLKVAQRTKYDLEGDEIAYETTRAAAQDIVAELTERGLTGEVETSPGGSWGDKHAWCTDDSCEALQDTTFSFNAQVAGIPVLGQWVRVAFDRNGERRSIEVLTLDIEVVGEAVAAIDEPTADLRFLELAQSAHPELIISFDREGQVAYLTPSEQGSPEVEPVWYAQWHTTSSEGRAGLLQSTSLSLTDPDAQLVPHARPE